MICALEPKGSYYDLHKELSLEKTLCTYLFMRAEGFSLDFDSVADSVNGLWDDKDDKLITGSHVKSFLRHCLLNDLHMRDLLPEFLEGRLYSDDF